MSSAAPRERWARDGVAKTLKRDPDAAPSKRADEQVHEHSR